MRGAVMAPSGRREDVAELRAKGGGADNILRHRDHVVKPDLREMERVAVLRAAVHAPRFLTLEHPEQAIPEDEDPGVIVIEVLDVRTVVDVMMSGRVHYPLERAEPVDRRGVD